MEEKTEEILQDLGLTANEIRIYLANLKLGLARVEAIASKAGVLRTTCYDILKSLVKKGFSASVIKSGVQYYGAAEPKKLLSLLDEKKKKVERILPELEIMKKSVLNKPSVQLYEGQEGLKSIYTDILATGKNLCGYGTAEHSWGLLTYFLPQFVKKRVKLGINSRLILEKSKKSREIKSRDKKQLRETRFMEALKKMETVVYIYGNKIAILTFVEKEPIGILMENRQIADSQKILFEELWKTAEKS